MFLSAANSEELAITAFIKNVWQQGIDRAENRKKVYSQRKIVILISWTKFSIYFNPLQNVFYSSPAFINFHSLGFENKFLVCSVTEKWIRFLLMLLIEKRWLG